MAAAAASGATGEDESTDQKVDGATPAGAGWNPEVRQPSMGAQLMAMLEEQPSTPTIEEGSESDADSEQDHVRFEGMCGAGAGGPPPAAARRALTRRTDRLCDPSQWISRPSSG